MGSPEAKNSVIASAMAGFTFSQGRWSVLVTVTKSAPKNTFDIPWIRKIAEAKGELAAALELGKSLVPFRKTGCPGWNFRLQT